MPRAPCNIAVDSARTFLLAVLSSLASSCGTIIGTDDYEIRSSDGGKAGLYASAECLDCFDAKCSSTVAECAQGATCRQVFDCYSACSDPSCAFDCELADAPNDAVAAMTSCLYSQCVNACDLGRNFECVGAYSPPAPLSDIEVPVNVVDVAGLQSPEGIHVLACPSPLWWCEPGTSAAEATVSGGIANLRTPSTNGWLGTLVFLDNRTAIGPAAGGTDAGSSERALLASQFMSPFAHVEPMWLFTHGWVESALSPLGGFEPDRGYVIVRARDCGHDPARDLMLEIKPAPDERTRVLYWGADNQAEPTLERTTLAGSVSASLAPEVQVQLLLRETITHRVFGCASVVPKASAYVEVWIYPRTEQHVCE